MRAARRLLAGLGLVLALGAQAATASSPVVARVHHARVRQVDFDHWMHVTALTAGRHRTPVPGTRAWEAFRKKVMRFLITSRWVIGETTLRKIVVGPIAARRLFDAWRAEHFPLRSAYRAYLRATSLTRRDIVYRLRVRELSLRLRDDVIKDVRGRAARQQALDAYVAEFLPRWKAKTFCARRYRVRECGGALPA